MKRLIIAAPQSGSGKTTICAGIIAALRRRGLKVTPFKAGPDYIDPTYHALAAGEPCHNLDAWLLTPAQVQMSFLRRSRGSDIALVEGMMGLFDGHAGYDDSGSAAHLARLLNTSVLLVLDVWTMARSAAAIVKGFRDFDPTVKIAGVLLNRVGSPIHARMVQEAIECETGVPVVGYLRHEEAFTVPERHLGLIPTAEPGRWQQWVTLVGNAIEQQVDLEQLLNLATVAPLEVAVADPPPLPSSTRPGDRAVIAVAYDAAFNFHYADNLDLLQAAGAELALFSPLHDDELPRGAQAIYLCGGFPELYAAELAANVALHQQLRRAHTAGLPIYAECGGLMYLTEAITDIHGVTRPMVGLLPGRARMEHHVTMGYRLLRARHDTWLWRKGEEMRGHEFHYSSWQARPATYPYLYEFQPDAYQLTPQLEGVWQGNLLASYTHLHFLAKPELAERFVAAARTYAPWSGISVDKEVNQDPQELGL
ncbi:MAG: cobyrinate a,c-diamide synthase [Caldilineaceae bacterium]